MESQAAKQKELNELLSENEHNADMLRGTMTSLQVRTNLSTYVGAHSQSIIVFPIAHSGNWTRYDYWSKASEKWTKSRIRECYLNVGFNEIV